MPGRLNYNIHPIHINTMAYETVRLNLYPHIEIPFHVSLDVFSVINMDSSVFNSSTYAIVNFLWKVFKDIRELIFQN